MADLEKVGAFALTEPEHGSDSVALETSARREGDEWVLDGAKRWIGNASVADVTVVWARDTEDEQVKGFLVEGDNPGFTATTMTGKGASRAIWQADITLEGVRVPEEMRLPEAASFKQTGAVLMSTRTSCAWSALGHAVASYDAALSLRGPARAVRQAADGLPAGAGPAGADAVRGHRDAAVLHAAGAARGRRPADAHHRRAGQAAQHAQGARR